MGVKIGGYIIRGLFVIDTLFNNFKIKWKGKKKEEKYLRFIASVYCVAIFCPQGVLCSLLKQGVANNIMGV